MKSNTGKSEAAGKKKIWMPLLLIPAQLIIDILLIVLGAIGDTALADPDALGHPVPFLTILAVIVAVAATLAVTIIAIISTIKRVP